MPTDIILLDFHATWCEPCKWAEPVVNLAVNMLDSRVTIEKIDIDTAPERAKEFNVLSVPTFVLLMEGKEVWRMNGFDTPQKMASAIRSAITLNSRP